MLSFSRTRLFAPMATGSGPVSMAVSQEKPLAMTGRGWWRGDDDGRQPPLLKTEISGGGGGPLQLRCRRGLFQSGGSIPLASSSRTYDRLKAAYSTSSPVSTVRNSSNSTRRCASSRSDKAICRSL